MGGLLWLMLPCYARGVMPAVVVRLRIDAGALQETVAWLAAEGVGTPGQLVARCHVAGDRVIPHVGLQRPVVERALEGARGVDRAKAAVRRAAEALSRDVEGTAT